MPKQLETLPLHLQVSFSDGSSVRIMGSMDQKPDDFLCCLVGLPMEMEFMSGLSFLFAALEKGRGDEGFGSSNPDRSFYFLGDEPLKFLLLLNGSLRTDGWGAQCVVLQ